MNTTTPATLALDPARDLLLDRVVDVSPDRAWAAWTTPEDIPHWFAPAPWSVVHCDIDLRPGGIFRTVMRSPDGQDTEQIGCYLEVVPKRRLVWTDALQAGYRPAAQPFFTAIITFEPHGTGTRYQALVMHRDPATRERHENMGFYAGWGKALDQLVAHVRTR